MEEYRENGQDKDVEKVLDDTASSLANFGGLGEESPENSPSGESVAIQDSYLSGMMTGQMKKFLGEFLAQNPFAMIPKRETKSLVLARLQGLPFGKILEDNPKLLDMFVDILRDNKALPNLLGLVNKPDKVKKFGFIALGVFIVVFLLNLLNSKGNIFRRILRKLAIGLLAFAFNTGAFYFIFREELTPLLNIVFKHYHL